MGTGTKIPTPTLFVLLELRKYSFCAFCSSASFVFFSSFGTPRSSVSVSDYFSRVLAVVLLQVWVCSSWSGVHGENPRTLRRNSECLGGKSQQEILNAPLSRDAPGILNMGFSSACKFFSGPGNFSPALRGPAAPGGIRLWGKPRPPLGFPL